MWKYNNGFPVWDGVYHNWLKMRDNCVGHVIRCSICLREHELISAGDWGEYFFWPPFRDWQKTPCPGTADPEEAVRQIIEARTFSLHLAVRTQGETRVSCWQDRIAGNPAYLHDYFGWQRYGKEPNHTTGNRLEIEGIEELALDNLGHFVAVTTDEIITVGLEGPRHEEVLLLFPRTKAVVPVTPKAGRLL